MNNVHFQQFIQNIWIAFYNCVHIKDTIRDGGSNKLYTAYTVYTALHCLNISTYVHKYCNKVRTQLDVRSMGF